MQKRTAARRFFFAVAFPGGGIIKHKKRKAPQENDLYYPSRGSGRYIYLSPAVAGDIYFVRADRRGLIKRKKRRTRKQIKLYYPWPTG